MSDPFAVTNLELQVVNALSEAWNTFLQLPTEHADDTSEFRQLIHAAQDKILARVGRRQVNGATYSHWDEPWSRIAAALCGSTIMEGSLDQRFEKVISTYEDSRIITSRAGDLRTAIRAARER